jgi:putative transposase
MLTDKDVEAIMSGLQMPESGRTQVRKARALGPVRPLQRRTDTVRTRYVSQKMGRALLAESRTVELAAIVWHEHRASTLEMWPQPFRVDLMLQGKSGQYRGAHTPDILIIEDDAIYLEEWREEERLRKLATERPKEFVQDADGAWHFISAEAYFAPLGLRHRLRTASELPKTLIANLDFLRHYMAENAPRPPADVLKRLKQLFEQRAAIPHLQLVHELGFDANHLYQAVLDGVAFVDLEKYRLDKVEQLIIYRDKTAGAIDALLKSGPKVQEPRSVLRLQEGAELMYEGKKFTIGMVGTETVSLVSAEGRVSQVPIGHVKTLFQQEKLEVTVPDPPSLTDLGLLSNARKADAALSRLRMLQNPSNAHVSKRTLRRWRKKIAGLPTHQAQLEALMPQHTGNVASRVSPEVLALAQQAVREHHNTERAPSVHSTYQVFVNLCANADLLPMARSAFYEWLKGKADVRKREGKKKAYQKAPIPLTFEDAFPVHGTHPHNVVYIDHTCLNQLLKGMNVANLGKPWLTVAIDGSNGEPLALYMDFRPPSAHSVLMLFRDYVIRHGRLPDTVVLDNGAEFHSAALLLFCEVFRINIRWRRRSRPRDSSLVERFFGATETEILACLDGNTRALKDPRSVSWTHKPEHRIEWTLPALHAAFEYYMFDIYPGRVHPRLGMSPKDFKKRQLVELGSRSHVHVRYDAMFRLMTSIHAGTPTRVIDRQRGIHVNGMYYWHDNFARAKHGEKAEVRLEMWCARVVYVRFRDEWLVAQARDGGRLEGRFLVEVETALHAERVAKKREAQKDANSAAVAAKKTKLWIPQLWDERLRDQMTESYLLYERLNMVEALPEAKNTRAKQFHVGTPERPDPQLLQRVEEEVLRAQGKAEQSTTATSVPAVESGGAFEPHDEYDYF